MAREDARELPELEGTPEQIEWAFRLRADLIAKLRSAKTDLSPNDIEACLKAIVERRDARFFIDERGDLSGALLGRPRDDGGLEANLPALSGTEKQVAWAGRIRSTFVRTLDAARRASFRDALARLAQAGFWIDNRDRLLDALDAEATGVSKGGPKGTIVLPALQGTEKQISWGERVRAAFIATLTESEEHAWAKTIAKLAQATFYIDHRDDVREGLQSEIAEPGSSGKLRTKKHSSNWE